MTSMVVRRFQDLIDQATVDCANESEQTCGFFTQLDQALTLPFDTTLLSVPITVFAIDLTDDDRIIAICQSGPATQRIPLVDLPLPMPPDGSDWIVAYRYWVRRTGGR